MHSIDNFLQKIFGIPYLKLTRDFSIHERCSYLCAHLDLMNIPAGKKISILDVGCGSGMTLRYLAQRKDVARYVGIDLNASHLVKRYNNIKNIDHNFFNINIDSELKMDETFDVIWSSEVIEHIINDVKLLKSMACHLNDNGSIIITSPSEKFVKNMGNYFPFILEVSDHQDGGHVRLGYSPESIRVLAQCAGLEAVRIDGVSRADLKRIQRRFLASPAVRLADNLRLALTSNVADRFVIGDDYLGMEKNYWSIGATLRRATSMVVDN